jgi:type I restriction enzyme S subunit
MSESPVPTGWKRSSVQELIERKFTGPSPTCEERPIANDEEWGILKTTAVTWNGWNELAHKVPPPRYWGNESIEVHPGDVLITKAGPRHRVGVVVHVPSTRPHIMVSGKMVGLRPKRSVVLPQILAGLLSTKTVQEYLSTRTTGMAESQTNFANEALLSANLEVPTMSEQYLIADILDTIDSQIRAAEMLTEKLGTIESAILEHQLNGLPRESYVRLADYLLVPPKNGYSPVAASESTGEYMLGLGCLTDRGFIPRQLKHAPLGDLRLQPFRLRDGDVLVSRANTRDLVGLAGVFRDVGAPCYYPDLMMRLVPSGAVSNTYLATVLNTQRVRRQIMNDASGTSGSMVKITKSTVGALTLPIPSRSDQNRIEATTGAVTGALASEVNQLDKLRLLKAGLMNDLLTGRVRVSSEVAS